MQRQPLAVIQDPSNPGTPSGDSQNAMPYSALQASYQSAARSRINPTANSTSTIPQQVLMSSPVHHSQRLKVEDALTYLDQVKIKFASQPQVYNDFLDIMKEFKSQSIDTPGVIQRVSNLFKGHSALITGFNTFLPPGYKIDVLENNEISVSMPPNIPSTPSTKNIANSHTPVATTASSISLQPGNNSQRVLLGSNQGSGSGGTGPYSGSSALSSPSPTHPSSPLSGSQPASQPVEFNHAINYVNKIKNRFMGQPDIYKQFLEILHTYQKEQRIAKDGGHPHHNQKVLTESEVYMQVANLFQNQADLLQEFGQFLPDANGGSNQLVNLHQQTQQQASPTVTTSSNLLPSIKTEPGAVSGGGNTTPKKSSSLHHHHHHHHKSSGLNSSTKSLKHSGSNLVSSSVKKMKMTSLDDITFAEAGKCGTLVEFAFFDKVHAHLKNKEDYDNFMRCIILYNQEVISRTELLKMVTPFISKWPELFKWFKDFLGLKEVPPNEPNKLHERLGGELASTEIDYSSCKKYGTSYRALPKNYVQPKCSGRTQLCKEVLNDTWVSFPSWSEDSTFVSSKKTPYEESIYRCEDERFELDVVIEINSSCIRSFESIAKKIARMSVEEKAKFHLDDSLGSSSTVINKQAISRIYGDKAPDVIEGLKKNPVLAVPIVLKRLKEKEEEWKAAQRSFNKVWREQNEKFYLKSLDHQGITFKQTDAKYIRSKNLLNEIETVFEEHQDQGEDDPGGPHLTLFYKDKAILEDVANLIIHHVKRQTSINKDDKHKIKVLLRHFIPDYFSAPRGILSDDEIEADDDTSTSASQTDAAKLLCTESLPKADSKNQDCLLQSPLQNNFQDDSYALFMVNSHWYLFFRFHNILCERLLKIYNCATDLAADEAKDKKNRDIAVSEALRLKPKNEFDVEEYYPAFLDLVKGLLDNNVESTQFEDALREMFGIHAYPAFTLDKVVGNAVRQLQNIVAAGGTGLRCRDLYLQEQRNGATGGPCVTATSWAGAESAYQRKAEALLAEESCFKVIFYKKEGKMSIEMLESYSENSEYEHCDNWGNYVDEYARAQGLNLSEELKETLGKKKPFLLRNTRSVKDSMKKQNEEDGVTMLTNQSGLFKRQSLYKARKMHRSITLRKNERFRSWHQMWACDNVSPEQGESLKKWFLESNILCHHVEPSLTRTPYLAYNRYRSDVKQL